MRAWVASRIRVDRTAAALLTVALGAGVVACAHTDVGVQHAVATTRTALHGVSLAAGEAAPAWSDQVDARIAYCKRQNLPDTAEARSECMGVFGEGERFEDEMAELREAYDEGAEALERMEEAARRLDAMLKGQRP